MCNWLMLYIKIYKNHKPKSANYFRASYFGKKMVSEKAEFVQTAFIIIQITEKHHETNKEIHVL